MKKSEKYTIFFIIYCYTNVKIKSSIRWYNKILNIDNFIDILRFESYIEKTIQLIIAKNQITMH